MCVVVKVAKAFYGWPQISNKTKKWRYKLYYRMVGRKEKCTAIQQGNMYSHNMP